MYLIRKYHMKILLGDFNAKVVRVVNFITSIKSVKSTMFLCQKNHKSTWTTTDGKTQIDDVVIDKRQHSSMHDVQFLKGLT
jgi:hypothetical protein